jgi:hypothetical protein
MLRSFIEIEWGIFWKKESSESDKSGKEFFVAYTGERIYATVTNGFIQSD